MRTLSSSAFLILFFIVCLSQNAWSQNTLVSGKANGETGKLVRLIVYDDLFSHWQKTLSSTSTQTNGSFNLSTDFNETTIAFLALGLKKGEFYFHPGSSYSVEIPLDTNTKRGSVFDELPLQFYLEANDNGLTESLSRFNADYNEFVIENTNRIYRNRDKKLIRDFSEAIQTEYEDVEIAFFKNYVKYTLAQLEWISKVKPDDSIAAEYFIHQPVLYQNVQYAEFFSDFFKAKFGSTTIYSYDELISAINSNKGYIGIDRLLQRSGLLASDTEVRELVAILLLSKKYYNPDVRKQKIIGMLTELQRNSKYLGIQKVSGNFIKKLTKLDYGTLAPQFILVNANGESVSLDRFRGKFVLLNFNREECKPCLFYMQNLEELRKEFNGKLEIVSLVTDEGFEQTNEYNSLRDFDWTLLNIDDQILLLEDYNIRAYPAYILLNPDLTVAMATAPLPGEGLSLYIKRYMNRYNQNKAENEDK